MRFKKCMCDSLLLGFFFVSGLPVGKDLWGMESLNHALFPREKAIDFISYFADFSVATFHTLSRSVTCHRLLDMDYLSVHQINTNLRINRLSSFTYTTIP